jgi:hypothetical protein
VWDFAEVCARVREHRQLILSTHDHRFASLLRRKLTPREADARTLSRDADPRTLSRHADARTLSYEFAGWTRQGPRVNTTSEPLAEVLPLRRAS